jgi:tetratricopeptide (TPR) repeat protein
MAIRMPGILIFFFVFCPALALSGCLGDEIKANQQQLAQQQTELDQLKQQVVAIQAQRPSYSTVASPSGSCDTTVMHEATRKGGERFAAGDFAHALGYYQDAVTACPKNAQAQLNVARTYEAIGDRSQALDHYRLAANASGSDDAEAVQQAREALTRLGG